MSDTTRLRFNLHSGLPMITRDMIAPKLRFAYYPARRLVDDDIDNLLPVTHRVWVVPSETQTKGLLAVWEYRGVQKATIWCFPAGIPREVLLDHLRSRYNPEIFIQL